MTLPDNKHAFSNKEYKFGFYKDKIEDCTKENIKFTCLFTFSLKLFLSRLRRIKLFNYSHEPVTKSLLLHLLAASIFYCLSLVYWLRTICSTDFLKDQNKTLVPLRKRLS